MTTVEYATTELIAHALYEISHKYDASGQSPRAYHNLSHTTAVISDTALLCEKSGLEVHETLLLKISAAFHDVIHNGDSDPDNEQNSASYARLKMSLYDCFSEKDTQAVVSAILATKCPKKYPKIIQSPSPGNIMDQLVCDADLASFGKPFDQFISSANSYFFELNPKGMLDSEAYSKFLDAEKVILGNHRFWTKEARKEFPHTRENVKIIISTDR